MMRIKYRIMVGIIMKISRMLGLNIGIKFS